MQSAPIPCPYVGQDACIFPHCNCRAERYFLDQDHDTHWYLIPEKRRAEWQAFLDIPTDDERSWVTPDFVRALDGPNAVTFTDPQ